MDLAETIRLVGHFRGRLLAQLNNVTPVWDVPTARDTDGAGVCWPRRRR